MSDGAAENKIAIGGEAIYKDQRVKIVRAAFPRFGDKRVVVRRMASKGSFTVAVKYLKPIAAVQEVEEKNEDVR